MKSRLSIQTPLLITLLAASTLAQVDPRGRSILFVRGADGSGGLGQGSMQRRTEHLSDINNTSTQPGDHGFGELANLLRSDGFQVTQWIESQGQLTSSRLGGHRIVVFGSNNRTYSASEISAFHAFMDAGGSALFISDANWGSNWDAAPQSDNQLLIRYGLGMYQDSANGVPVIARASSGRFAQPDYPALSGPDGAGGKDDVDAYDGEGVSFLNVQRGSGGWVSSVLVTATGFRVRLLSGNGAPGQLVAAGSRDGAMVMSQKGNGLVLGHFDRNTFFNRNGTGTNLYSRDNRQLAIDIFRTLASVPGRARSIGSSCGGSSRKPTSIVGAPNLGRVLSWSLRGAAPRAATSLLLAGGPPRSTRLPGGCVLQPDLATLVVLSAGTTDGSGNLQIGIPLPDAHPLSGNLATGQMLILTPGGPALGIAELGNGIELRLGFAR